MGSHHWRRVLTAGAFLVVASIAAMLAGASPRVLAAPSPFEDERHDVSAALEAIRAKHDLPGMGAIGTKDGRTMVAGATGRRRIDDETPITFGDRFHIGSCGKAMTSTMLASLVEEGVLSWETTILEAIPDLEDSMDPGFAEVTLLQLLQHRGGIAERRNPELNQRLITQFANLEGSPQEQRWKVMADVLSQPPTTKPGASMEYSNYGYMTAAAMAEELTGQSWQELMTERLFKPLHMSSAGLSMPGTPGVIDEPRGHQKSAQGWKVIEPGTDPDLPECIAPAGLIHCSLEDWAKFVQAHLDGERGKDGLLKAETFRLLHRAPEGSEYACGWGVVKREWTTGPVYTHTGSNGVWFSVVWAAPEPNVMALAVTNGASGTAPVALDEAVVVVFQTMGIIPAAGATSSGEK
ncbi:MAG: serine hydrolase domain-containing protein [Planctomycetota bacterium]